MKKNCPICSNPISKGLVDWHLECLKCRYESSNLKPSINEKGSHIYIDESFRENGLKSLRFKNFNKLLRIIRKIGKQSGKLLDVGCAHGWFLDLSKKNGFQTLGIEPDTNIFQIISKRGLPVRHGFFPDALSSNEQFDVIAFNDVFEHIPNLSTLLTDCKVHLKPNGILVLNLPNSTGLFYKLSRLLFKFGFKSFFDRLWQKGLPSPHVHYFNLNNLHMLLRNNGFEPIASGRLQTLDLKGLFNRISYTGNHPFFARLMVFLVIIVCLPITLIMPSDIIFTIAKKSSCEGNECAC